METLVLSAQEGTTPLATAVSASSSSSGYADASGVSFSEGVDNDGAERGVVSPDVNSVPGLVTLTIGCLEQGQSDEATIMQRHLTSPDFGHPLLRLASPSSTEVEFPHMPDEDEVCFGGLGLVIFCMFCLCAVLCVVSILLGVLRFLRTCLCFGWACHLARSDPPGRRVQEHVLMTPSEY